METTKYISGAGKEVTLYEFDNGYKFTLVMGTITIYTPNGDMACSASSIESAIEICKGN